jgi:hypothetical protein
MLNTRLFLVAAVLVLGCNKKSGPAPGMSALKVHVQAEPKPGIKPPPEPSAADTSAASDYSAFERFDYSKLDHVVVWLEPVAPSSSQTPPSALTVEIDPSRAAPELTNVASIGQQIVFHNASAAPLSIYSVSDGNEFDLGAVAPQGQGQFTVKSAGVIEVLTGASAEPLIIYAAPTRWVAMTKAGETAEFNDLPPGQYRLLSWHPRLPGSQTNVSLSADQTSEASVLVTVNSLPQVGANR